MSVGGRVVMSHRQYEHERPDEQAYARALQPSREFPCPGILYAYHQTPAHVLAACDTCGYETSFKARLADREPAPRHYTDRDEPEIPF
jgi:hypothetical protein